MSTRILRYSGGTVEEAVQNAIDALGRDIEILHARKVRRGGVMGFFAHEHVEVTVRAEGAGPRPAAEPLAPIVMSAAPIVMSAAPVAEAYQLAAAPAAGASVFDDHLERAMASIEAREQAAAAPAPRRLTPDDLAPLAADEPDAGAATVSAAPAPTPSAGATATPSSHDGSSVDVIDLRALDRAASPSVAAVDPGAPRWSLATLRAVGVPAPVLAHLSPLAPDDTGADLAWTAALTEAISRSIPPASAHAPVAVHGYGAEAAVTLLAHAVAGIPIGALHLAEGPVVASPFELALAVRSCLPR